MYDEGLGETETAQAKRDSVSDAECCELPRPSNACVCGAAQGGGEAAGRAEAQRSSGSGWGLRLVGEGEVGRWARPRVGEVGSYRGRMGSQSAFTFLPRKGGAVPGSRAA